MSVFVTPAQLIAAARAIEQFDDRDEGIHGRRHARCEGDGEYLRVTVQTYRGAASRDVYADADGQMFGYDADRDLMVALGDAPRSWAGPGRAIEDTA